MSCRWPAWLVSPVAGGSLCIIFGIIVLFSSLRSGGATRSGRERDGDVGCVFPKPPIGEIARSVDASQPGSEDYAC